MKRTVESYNSVIKPGALNVFNPPCDNRKCHHKISAIVANPAFVSALLSARETAVAVMV